MRREHRGIAFNRHFDGDGATIYKHACALGCEGIVSKRLGSPYRPGRQDCWIQGQEPCRASGVSRGGGRLGLMPDRRFRGDGVRWARCGRRRFPGFRRTGLQPDSRGRSRTSGEIPDGGRASAVGVEPPIADLVSGSDMEAPVMSQFFLCKRPFKFGPHIYNGRRIAKMGHDGL